MCTKLIKKRSNTRIPCLFELTLLVPFIAGSNMTYNTLISATQKLQGTAKMPRCNTSKDWWKPCQCRFEICIGWYPCGLKYCRGRDSAGKVVSYRCGIKTCKKCRSFEFYVGQKSLCMWDEAWQWYSIYMWQVTTKRYCWVSNLTCE